MRSYSNQNQDTAWTPQNENPLLTKWNYCVLQTQVQVPRVSGWDEMGARNLCHISIPIAPSMNPSLFCRSQCLDYSENSPSQFSGKQLAVTFTSSKQSNMTGPQTHFDWATVTMIKSKVEKVYWQQVGGIHISSYFLDLYSLSKLILWLPKQLSRH